MKRKRKRILKQLKVGKKLKETVDNGPNQCQRTSKMEEVENTLQEQDKQLLMKESQIHF